MELIGMNFQEVITNMFKKITYIIVVFSSNQIDKGNQQWNLLKATLNKFKKPVT